MEKKEKRRRGAPKGNKNASKYYARGLEKVDQLDLDSANRVEGIDEEIALLRHEIKKAIRGGDERNLLLIVKAAGAIEKLIRTRYRISNSEHKGLMEGVANVINRFLLPLGSAAINAVITKKLSE
jgi:N-acetylglucosamine kinase-like BadF-type ATPase